MEYIKNIEIKNFKSIRHQIIDDCKRINVFIGYPNVGKSNILEAIGLYSFLQLDPEIFDFKDICRVRNFAELFYNHDAKQIIEISINEKIGLQASLNSSRDLDLIVRLLVDSHGEQDSLLLTKLAFDQQTRTNTFSRISPSNYRQVVGSIKKYDFRKDIDINKRKGLSLSIPFGDNLLDVLQGSSILRREISAIFEKYELGLLIDQIDGTIRFLKKMEDGTSVIIPYHQVADTLQRLIFYKAAIETNKGSVLLFEEPEAHMFPPYMRKFTSDIVLDTESQFFIATHSPYILDAFLEDAEKSLSIYLVYYEKGQTKIKLMECEQLEEVKKYGVDLFFNLESYLKNGQVNNA